MPCCCQGLSFAPAVLEKGIQGRDGEVPRRFLMMMMDLPPTRQRRSKLARTRQDTEKKTAGQQRAHGSVGHCPRRSPSRAAKPRFM